MKILKNSDTLVRPKIVGLTQTVTLEHHLQIVKITEKSEGYGTALAQIYLLQFLVICKIFQTSFEMMTVLHPSSHSSGGAYQSAHLLKSFMPYCEVVAKN